MLLRRSQCFKLAGFGQGALEAAIVGNGTPEYVRSCCLPSRCWSCRYVQVAKGTDEATGRWMRRDACAAVGSTVTAVVPFNTDVRAV